jgi:lipopolysaccharide export system permease protein
MKNRPDFQLDIKQNKIWYRSGSLMYNLKAFDTKNQTIVGMAVYAFDDNFQLSQTIEAEKAKYTSNGWKLINGTLTQFSQTQAFPENKKFSELKLQINETPADFQEIEKEVDGLRMFELYRYIEQTAKAGLDTKSFLVKFHSRFSLSFIPLIMCILAVPFSVTGRREGGVAKDLSICLAITFFYWLFYSIGLSLGTNGSLTPWFAAWAPTVIFAVLASILVSRKQNG